MRASIKVVGTLLVVVLLAHPLWAPDWGSGILGEIWSLGFPAGMLAVLTFFGVVGAYCRTLHLTLMRVDQSSRPAAPGSVWLMFAIPYNFVEDFFIVNTVARSLRRDGTTDPRRLKVWQTIGLGWCSLQVVSLLPGPVGYVGGAAALVAWAIHWVLTVRVNRRLAGIVKVTDSRGDDAPS